MVAHITKIYHFIQKLIEPMYDEISTGLQGFLDVLREGYRKRSLNISATSAVDNNLENIPPPSKFQRFNDDDDDLLDKSSTDLSADNDDDDFSETSNEDSPVPLEGSSRRNGDLPGSDILSTVEDYTQDILVHMCKIEVMTVINLVSDANP